MAFLQIFFIAFAFIGTVLGGILLIHRRMDAKIARLHVMLRLHRAVQNVRLYRGEWHKLDETIGPGLRDGLVRLLHEATVELADARAAAAPLLGRMSDEEFLMLRVDIMSTLSRGPASLGHDLGPTLVREREFAKWLAGNGAAVPVAGKPLPINTVQAGV